MPAESSQSAVSGNLPTAVLHGAISHETDIDLRLYAEMLVSGRSVSLTFCSGTFFPIAWTFYPKDVTLQDVSPTTKLLTTSTAKTSSAIFSGQKVKRSGVETSVA